MQENRFNIRQRYTDILRRWDKAKLRKSVVFMFVIITIFLTIFLGFTRGGWRTEGRVNKMAESSAQDVIIARLTSICVAQFNADPEQAEKLEALKALGSFQRPGYVREQGWATMPGDATPDEQVATECAKQIALIGE